MGLDNGIIIIPKTERGKDFLESFYSPELMEEAEWKENPWNKEWDFSYWRKCYNIRNKFLQEFSDKYDKEKQEINFNFNDIPHIIKVLKYFLKENNWEKDGCSIWEWHQRIIGIAETIHYFYVLFEDGIYRERITEEDIEIFFYNSY